MTVVLTEGDLAEIRASALVVDGDIATFPGYKLVTYDSNPYVEDVSVWQSLWKGEDGMAHYIECVQDNYETTFGFRTGGIIRLGQVWPVTVETTAYRREKPVSEGPDLERLRAETVTKS